ncbi:MAG TPA: 8-amino-7-oxononanoate synthase [Candidatus Kapabacteria bacterium]|nr:8-amino-7-oxononanoate synthase [Candidatus Kapabacteria bacterium]
MSSQTKNNIDDTLNEILARRKEESTFRSLFISDNLIDFCSNDYLSFARNKTIQQRTEQYSREMVQLLSGSTGSRCISGNTNVAEKLERQLGAFHNADAALLFNSGYDANVGLFSSIAREGDTIITDELIHASIIDGCRLSRATKLVFTHNSLTDLETQLKLARGNIFVGVESVYSMDGDTPPLREMAELCKKYNVSIIVDEAHATGVFGEHGRGVVNALGLEREIFARVHTFGKALGCHGAVVVGSNTLRDYLVNFARSFIFTTALPVHSLFAIRSAYEELMSDTFDNSALHSLIKYFKNNFRGAGDITLIPSDSAVQSIVIPGSERARSTAEQLQKRGFDVRAIRSPSVPLGKERLRVNLHLHNTQKEIDDMLAAFTEVVKA